MYYKNMKTKEISAKEAKKLRKSLAPLLYCDTKTETVRIGAVTGIGDNYIMVKGFLGENTLYPLEKYRFFVMEVDDEE